MNDSWIDGPVGGRIRQLFSISPLPRFPLAPFPLFLAVWEKLECIYEAGKNTG
jgi:hypothetical protein